MSWRGWCITDPYLAAAERAPHAETGDSEALLGHSHEAENEGDTQHGAVSELYRLTM